MAGQKPVIYNLKKIKFKGQNQKAELLPTSVSYSREEN